jgi:GDP-L-fucose synthase
MEKTSKIYIAGHRGLVGSAIARRLKAEGCTNLVYRTFKQLDLTRQQKVEAFFEKEKPEYVFLAAAKVGGIWSNDMYPAEFIYSNLAIQSNITHAAYRTGVKKLLFLGSSCIYPKHCPQPMKEEHLLSGYMEPTNEPYAVAKIAGIKTCQSYNRQYGTNFVSVMPTNLYGPNDNFDLENSHVLPALIRKFHLAKSAAQKDWEIIRRNEAAFGSIPADIKQSIGMDPVTNQPFDNSTDSLEVILWGTGAARREFLFVDDLADACLYIMNTYNDSEIVNIGSGKDQTIRELAEIVSEVVGFSSGIKWDASKPDGTPLKLLDVSKLKNLGWQAKTAIKDGIQKTYAWYLKKLG